MGLIELYKSIETNIARVDFSKLWDGFIRYDFALYDNNNVVINNQLFAWNSAFVANTAIYYKGRYIAIWKVSQDNDIDILTSKIIHEMFHAYQMDKGEKRFANEVEAINTCKLSLEYLELKYRENKLLAQLQGAFQMELWHELLKYRKYRKQHYSYEYNYEMAIEAIEGAAQYVELAALKQLNKVTYEEAMKCEYQRLSDINKLLPVRINCYDSGAVMINICIGNEFDLSFDVGSNKEIFYSSLLEMVDYSELKIEISEEIIKYYEQDQINLKKKCREIKRHSQNINGDFLIIGFNVYDARKCGEYIYTNFLSYQDDKNHTLSGDILFKLEGTIIKEIMVLNK